MIKTIGIAPCKASARRQWARRSVYCAAACLVTRGILLGLVLKLKCFGECKVVVFFMCFMRLYCFEFLGSERIVFITIGVKRNILTYVFFANRPDRQAFAKLISPKVFMLVTIGSKQIQLIKKWGFSKMRRNRPPPGPPLPTTLNGHIRAIFFFIRSL